MTKLIRVRFEYKIDFYPTKRSRKLRTCKLFDSLLVPVFEAEENEFPLAFSYPTGYGDDERTEVIRSFKGELYKRYFDSNFADNEKELLDHLQWYFRYSSDYLRYSDESEYDPLASVVVNSERNEVIQKLLDKALCMKYILFKGQLWELTNEPRYALSWPISIFDNSDPWLEIEPKGPFNATQLDLAYSYYKKKLLGRGSEPKSLDEALPLEKRIVVHDPSFVTPYQHKVYFQHVDEIEFGYQLIEIADIRYKGLRNRSPLIEEESLSRAYLASLVFQNGELTPLGKLCMDKQSVEVLKVDGEYIARLKVDYFE
ncbi:hypothetical protein HO924_09350 [Streptococcus suis]|nr:hypothetical protein [Streptococcus suis]